MDFYSQQDLARRKSNQLVGLFLLMTLMISLLTVGLVSINFPQLFIINANYISVLQNKKVRLDDLDFVRLSLSVFGVMGLITLISMFKIMMIKRAGGEGIAESLGGRLLDFGSQVPKEKRLSNVVEEMALAAGCPVPKVYILDGETSINAFAAGEEIDASVIAVTRGAIDKLSRDELQGVVAHEFSHILYGDMKLNMNLIGVLYGLLFLNRIGEVLMRGSRRRGTSKRNSGSIGLFGLGLYLLGLVGYFLGQIIKAAVSRQREFLADASAVQFTRAKHGISGALKKIYMEKEYLSAERAVDASHMFFADGLKTYFRALLGTHPPLPHRISLIEGRKVGEEEIADDLKNKTIEKRQFTENHQSKPTQTGLVTPERIAAAAAFIQQVSAHPQQADRSGFQSSLSVLVLFYIHSAMSLEAFTKILENYFERNVLTEFKHALAAIESTDSYCHIPLIDLWAPGLRLLSEKQKTELLKSVISIIECDSETKFIEYIYYKVLKRILFPKPGARERQQKRVSPTLASAQVLSVLAYFGHEDPKLQELAFAKGLAPLNLHGTHDLKPRALSVGEFDYYLSIINRTSFKYKKFFIDVCSDVIFYDQKQTPIEAAMIRGISDTLGCPASFFN